MTKHVRTTLALLIVMAMSAVAGAGTLSNAELMALELQGWNGSDATLDSKVDQGALGVDFTGTMATNNYGQLAMSKDAPLDFGSDTMFYLKVELLSASGASESIELNPFIKTGGSYAFNEDKDGMALGVGESYILDWDLSGVPDIDDIKGYGFQLFTAGGAENPEAMDVTVRVSPVPEPASMLVLGLGGAVLAWKKRR
jgi:hypothetical protein